MLRVRSAIALGGYRVRLTLTDGSVVERDLGSALRGPVFEPLRRSPELFAEVYVEAGTIAWPGDLDIDPNTLIWGGAPPSDPSVRPAPFLKIVPPRLQLIRSERHEGAPATAR